MTVPKKKQLAPAGSSLLMETPTAGLPRKLNMSQVVSTIRQLGERSGSTVPAISAAMTSCYCASQDKKELKCFLLRAVRSGFIQRSPRGGRFVLNMPPIRSSSRRSTSNHCHHHPRRSERRRRRRRRGRRRSRRRRRRRSRRRRSRRRRRRGRRRSRRRRRRRRY